MPTNVESAAGSFCKSGGIIRTVNGLGRTSEVTFWSARAHRRIARSRASRQRLHLSLPCARVAYWALFIRLSQAMFSLRSESIRMKTRVATPKKRRSSSLRSTFSSDVISWRSPCGLNHVPPQPLGTNFTASALVIKLHIYHFHMELCTFKPNFTLFESNWTPFALNPTLFQTFVTLLKPNWTFFKSKRPPSKIN